MKAVDLPLDSIRILLKRARDKEGWEGVRDSMKTEGLLVPIQVRDLGRADRNGCRYELVCGQGRLEAARSLKWESIPALIIDTDKAALAGRFLAENMIRKPLPWATRGRMIRDRVQAGEEIGDIAKSLHISLTLATKYYRVVSKLAQDSADEIASLPVNDAEVLTTIPARGQRIVLDIAGETGMPVREVSKAAKAAVKEGAGWTKGALQKAIQSKHDELDRLRKKLKLLRLHRALGPGNLERLMRLPKFKSAAKAEGVNLARFEQ